MAGFDQLDYFEAEEFASPALMQRELLLKLDETRRRAGVSMFVSSSYRPGDRGAHGGGWAVDVVDDTEHNGYTGRWAYKVITAALAAGFTRIGVETKHIHLDCDPRLPPRVIFPGVSR
jgi:hypothetical protein